MQCNCSNLPLEQKKVSSLVRCLDFRGCNVHKQGVWGNQVCPVCRGVSGFRIPGMKGSTVMHHVLYTSIATCIYMYIACLLHDVIIIQLLSLSIDTHQ